MYQQESFYSSNNGVFLNAQPQYVEQRVELVSNPPQGISYTRTEVMGEYEFQAKGRYTTQALQAAKALAKRASMVSTSFEFSFDNTASDTCDTHKEVKDYILMSKVDKYRIFDTICKNCLSQINYKNPNPAKAELFDAVIIDNKDKIMEIRENKINLGGADTSETMNALKEFILPLADELIFLSENFEAQICGKIGGNTARAEEIAKLKSFIASIELNPNGDPNVFGIGQNIPLKHKYIKLALFLLNFTGISNEKVDNKGICEYLKSHMIKMIQLRKAIILRITSWLKYLTGGFYDFLHNFEGIPVDENFRKNLQIDYVSEEDLLKLKNFYEAELRKRDERIRVLEEENAKFKLTINQLSADNQNLSNMNNEYAKQIDAFKKEIAQLKLDFENRLRNFEKMKNEYEAKINEYLLQLNQWKSKFSELENKYNLETRKLIAERDQLLGQIKLLNQRYENDMKSLSDKYDALTKEFNNLKVTLNNHVIQINQLTNDKENLERAIESLKNHIKSLENDLKNANNSLNALLKERDELRVQLTRTIQERDGLRVNLENARNQIAGLENQINILTKERDELRGQLTIALQERDGLRINLENLKNQNNSSETQLKNLISQINMLSKERDDLRAQLTALIQERDGLRINLDNAKSQLNSLDQAIKNLTININNLTKERDELRAQLTATIQERDGLRNSLENARNQINSLDQAVKNLTVNVNNLTKERDDCRNQINLLNADVEKLRGEITILTNIKTNYEGRIKEFQKILEDLTAAYNKLQNEFNMRLSIISTLENKVNGLNGTVSSHEGTINMYLATIKKLDDELKNARREIEELKTRLLIIAERDSEIASLKLALTSCRDEWNKLSEAYEGLLVDIKNQITINDSLRMIIFELQSKIDSHNLSIGGLDNSIRQQLEILTRQTLSKKSIDYNQNSDPVKRSQSEIENLRVKIGRIENAKLNKSTVLTNLTITLDKGNKNVVSALNSSVNVVSSGNTGFDRDASNNLNNSNLNFSSANAGGNVYKSTYEQRYNGPNINYRSNGTAGYSANLNASNMSNYDGRTEEIVEIRQVRVGGDEVNITLDKN